MGVFIINGRVHLGTDHSKGLFFNRVLDNFSECQYNMSFMFKSGRTFQMVGQIYQVKRRQIKKEGKKRWGENRKKRKKKKKEEKKEKRKKKEKSTKQKKRKKEREKEGGREEDRMKNRKEKER